MNHGMNHSTGRSLGQQRRTGLRRAGILAGAARLRDRLAHRLHHGRMLRAGRPNDTDEQVEQHVSARMERQAVLARENAPFLWAVVDEVALRRPVGEAKVMHGQLARLVEAVRNPRIKILIVPLSVGAHAGLAGHFVIAEFDGAPDIVYLETAARAQISDQPDVVKACTLAFDTLRAEALGPKASLELMSEVMETWS
jgi:hypothetical protein